MGKITFDINNGGKIMLEQFTDDRSVFFCTSCLKDGKMLDVASFDIPATDFVMLMNIYEYFKRTGEWLPGEFLTNPDIIRVRYVGAIPDYYRTYYYDDLNNKYYAVMDWRGQRTWYTTACNGGEPDCPLKDGLVIEVREDGNEIRREKISRVDDCTSIGTEVKNNA